MISKELIATINRIHDVCAKINTPINVDLPQLIVVGSQSAGKSSALENIVGRDFLPRGTGMVTRCPLRIKLIQEKNGSREYGVFGHNPQEKIYDFHQIRKEIEKQTKRLAGSEEGVSDAEITLSIFSPNVLDLTLIDLPGVIHNAESSDTVDKIKEMNVKFISNENSLILVILKADDCIQNSGGLALAKQVDETGVRTIGVITKLDKAKDEDVKSIKKIMEGKKFQLRRPYIGIISRSEDDIKTNKSIEDTLKFEEEYIKGHPYFKTIADRLGTHHLRKVLSEQLSEHIEKILPKLQKTWLEEMISLQQDIKKYEELHPQDPKEQSGIIIKNIREVESNFKQAISDNISEKIRDGETSCGCKIKQIFFERLPIEISAVVYKDEELEKEIKKDIELFNGVNVGLGEVPFKVFEKVVREQVKKIKPPVTNAINLVVAELSGMIPQCVKHLKKYPKLHRVTTKYIMEFINTNGMSFHKNVLAVLEMEKAYMNTAHEEFVRNQKQNELNGVNSNHEIRKGDLNIAMKNDNQYTYRVTLRSTTLTCTRKSFNTQDSQDDLKPVIKLSLNGLDVMPYFTGSNIILYRPDGKNVIDNYRELNFICSAQDGKSWFESFSAAVRNANNDTSTAEILPNESIVQKTFEYSASYMKIVKKTIRDMVPKAIMLYIVKELEKFIHDDLLNKFFSNSDDGYAQLLEVNSNELSVYEANKKMVDTLKKMLEQMNG